MTADHASADRTVTVAPLAAPADDGTGSATVAHAGTSEPPAPGQPTETPAPEVARAAGPTSSAQAARGDLETDRSTIAGLAGDLLPALIARLDASDLGEVEVRADGWRVRLRRPYDRRRPVVLPEVRRRRPHPAAAGQAGGQARGSEIGGGPAGSGAGAASSADATTAGATGDRVEAPRVATSPTVGYFLPRDGMTAGRAVRAGDVVGQVDCLGVRHDVVAPIDGLIGTQIAQAGEAVEYGQPLLSVEVAESRAAGERQAPPGEAGPVPAPEPPAPVPLQPVPGLEPAHARREAVPAGRTGTDEPSSALSGPPQGAE